MALIFVHNLARNFIRDAVLRISVIMGLNKKLTSQIFENQIVTKIIFQEIFLNIIHFC